MKEDIMTIYCCSCKQSRKVNDMLWLEGKIFRCPACGKERFAKEHLKGGNNE